MSDEIKDINEVIDETVAEEIAEETAVVSEAEAVIEEPVAEEIAADEPVTEEVAAQDEPVAEEVVVETESVAEIIEEEPVAEEVKAEEPVEVKPEPIVQAENNIAARRRTENSVVRNNRKVRIGVVVSDKMSKTIVVAVKSRAKHPLYKKTVSSTAKFKAHDEKEICGIGDTVEIAETRHISKDKYFRLVRIVEKAK